MRIRFTPSEVVPLVAVMVGALLLASCSTTPAPSGPAGVSTTETKPYGSLRIAGGYNAGQVDPQKGTGTTWSTIGQAIFDSLLWLTPDQQVVPGIAERWEISPDGKTHTFYIRKGVKFHDGSDLTGADAKFSIERMMAPDSFSPGAGTLRLLIDNVELKDDYTVAVHLKVPYYDSVQGFEGSSSAVMPKKYIEEKGVEYFQKHLIGSGPWRAVKVEDGPRVTLEANEAHWREVPKFKTVEVLFVPEEATKVAMLKTGELDLALANPDSLAGLKAAGVRVFSFDGGAMFFGYHFYDIEHPEKYPQGDVRVRKAMQLAISNKEIADTIFGGLAAPYAVMNVSPSAYFFDPNVLKPAPYDPEGAKKLLAEAGYPNGFETRIYDTRAGTILPTVNVALSGYWRKVGIKADLVSIDYPSFQPKFLPKQSPEIWPSVFTYPSNEGIDFPSAYHSVKGPAINHTNARLNELIDSLPRTADPAEKKKIALEAARMGLEQYTVLTLVSNYTVLAYSAKIGEIAPVRGLIFPARIFALLTHPK